MAKKKTIKTVLLNDAAVLPTRATKESAGLDLRTYRPFSIAPGEIKLVKLGITMNVDKGYEIQIRPKSGLALEGITIVNSPGTVDSDYTGEIGVILMNLGDKRKHFNTGDGIAQAVVSKVELIDVEEVDAVEETERGDGGFGSTGH